MPDDGWLPDTTEREFKECTLAAQHNLHYMLTEKGEAQPIMQYAQWHIFINTVLKISK